MTIRIEGQGELIRWARKRARADIESLATRFPKIAEWERGDAAPTLKQLEDFANATHAPVGLLLLPEPPVEELPLPDFRTIGDVEVARPSPDLMDTISDLRGARFEEADLNNAFFYGAQISDDTMKSLIKAHNWREANLTRPSRSS